MPQSRSRQTIRPLPPSPPMVVKLPRNGPKGQSMEAWLYGKQKHSQRVVDSLRWKEQGQ